MQKREHSRLMDCLYSIERRFLGDIGRHKPDREALQRHLAAELPRIIEHEMKLRNTAKLQDSN